MLIMLKTPKAVGGRGSIQSQSSDCSLAKDKNPFYMATLTDLNGKQKDPEEGGRSAQRHREEDEWNSRVERPHSTTNDDPAGYIRAKRELKRAVLEHYRLVRILCAQSSRTSHSKQRFFSHLGFLVAWKRYTIIK